MKKINLPEIFHNKNFCLLLFSQLCSNVAAAIILFSIINIVFLEVGSSSVIALITILYYLPGTFLGILAGTIVDKVNKRKVFFISIELLQNIYHHAQKIDFDGDKKSYFHFVINKVNDKYYKISAGNFVNRHKCNTLISRIEQLNILSEIEVKQLYKSVLNNNEFSEKGGGGLGMIDIKRKSEENIEYNHIFFDDNLYFFNFSVFLENKN